MKKLLTVGMLIVLGAVPSFGQWAVFDIVNLQQSIINYAALTEQISRQATQISNQVQQIRQLDTQIQRLGDMATIRNLIGFPEFRADLSLPTQIKTWADRLARVDGVGIFGDTRSGIFQAVNSQFLDFDGTPVSRDPRKFKESHDMVVSVDQFKVVQSDVYLRRERLKTAVAQTSEAMRNAPTVAEQQKHEAVLNAQYGQLRAIDAEVAMMAADVQVKAAEAAAMNAAQSQAESEAHRELSHQEANKVSTSFKPIYDCLLQYVTERRLAP